MMKRHQWIVRSMGLAVGVVAQTVHAGGLGIPMDGFITQFTDTVVGLGYPIGLLGLAGWAGAHLNNVRCIAA